MNNLQQSKYRWYILILSALTHTFVVAMQMMCMPVLFKEISEELGLSLVQIGTVWGMVSLAGVFTGLLGGLVSDRFGTKRMLIFSCLLAGITGALRGTSAGVVSLALTVVLFGLITTTIPMIVYKTCGAWFSRRQLGLANGAVSMGMALGFMVGSMVSATFLSPLLGGWRNVLYFYGAISILISFLWFLTRGEPAQAEVSSGQAGTVFFRQAWSRIIRSKKMWLLGLMYMGVSGCYIGVFGYLPLYLREVGWSAAGADGALAALHGCSMIGAIPVALLSDRLGRRKPVLVVATIMAAIGVCLLAVADGALIWVAVLIAGIVRDGYVGVFTSMIIETEEVGAMYTGTAIGLIFTISRAGGVLAPTAGNSLASIGLNVPFIFWASLVALSLVGLCFFKETGMSGRGGISRR